MANDLEEIKIKFLRELRNASSGEKSSLSWIRNVLPEKSLIANGLIQAVVIGGSNYEFAKVKIENGKAAEVLARKNGPLPMLQVSDNLIEVFRQNYYPDVDAVAVNFAFPLTPTKGTKDELDGIFIHGTKEHVIKGLAGKPVGEFLKINIYKKNIPVTVANDTVCLTLSGSGVEKAAMILGTGFNMSLNLMEKTHRTVVNLEAGGFDGVGMTDSLLEIDRKSENPGQYLFEKSVAGRYLVEHYNDQIKKLKLKTQKIKSTKDLSVLAADSITDEGVVAKQILENSARIIAAAVAGLYEFLDKPAKLEIIVEGSLFWKGYKYHETVSKELKNLEIRKDAISFKQIPDSSLIGAINLLLG